MTAAKTRIYVAGHRGMVGSAISRVLQGKGDCEIVTRSHDELDLTDQRQEMYYIYCEGNYRIKAGNSKINFINKEANSLFFEGVQFFNDCNLITDFIVQHDDSVYILPWKRG